MHRAIPPQLIMPTVARQIGTLRQTGAFYVSSTTDVAVSSGAGIVTFDDIILDVGIGLSGSFDGVPAPAGTRYAMVACGTRSSDNEGLDYEQLEFRRDGTILATNAYHDAEFFTQWCSYWFACDPGEEVQMYLAVGGGESGDLEDIFFSGRFIG